MFAEIMSEMKPSLNKSVVQMAGQSIESGEKWVSPAIGFNTKATQWAKDAPVASISDTQRTFALKTFESSIAMAR